MEAREGSSIWLSSPHGEPWLEAAVDGQGTLDVLGIASSASVRLETLRLGVVHAHSGISIRTIQSLNEGMGSSEQLPVLVNGEPLPATHSDTRSSNYVC
jgi:hypothetical protein